MSASGNRTNHPIALPTDLDTRGGATREEIAAAASTLRDGGLVAFPTETVYGLGADASNPAAVARIFAAKGRPADHPLIVHLASADLLDAWAVRVPDVARRVAERFWPGPLTLVLHRHPDVPVAVTGGQDTVGVRVPSHPVAHALLTAFGGGVAAPSANRFGRVSPTTRERVVAELGDRVDLVLEGGACEVGLESTILDLTGERPRLLRPGGIGAAALAEVLADAPTRTVVGGPRTPGRLASHYAPTTPVRVVEAAVLPEAVRAAHAAGLRVAVLTADGDVARTDADAVVTMPSSADAYARELYARLAGVDALGCDVALVRRPPASAGWEAVHDRLGRSEGVDPHAPRGLVVVARPGDAGACADEALRAGVVLLSAWVGDAPPRVLTAPDGARPLHLGEPEPCGPGALIRLDASDENLGIPVAAVELVDALVATGVAGRLAPRPSTDGDPLAAALAHAELATLAGRHPDVVA
ncbi:L-threonylcarbamoyladenylate synthase [Actinotalea sp. AC32]|nr:L-threonylcarbamoyladenylate synthase [Actinotalea sp. AC32]